MTKTPASVIAIHMQYETCQSCPSSCSSKVCCTDRLKAFIAANGGRLTQERLSLLNVICNYKGHFSPEDLEKATNNSALPMALTTIYRNIPILLKAGIIRRTSVLDSRDDGIQYEHVWGKKHHDHIVCLECGKRVEFNYPALEVLQDAVAKEHGFKPVTHHMELMGICKECRDVLPNGSDFQVT